MRIAIVNQYAAPDISPTARLAASLAGHRAARGDEVAVVAGRARYSDATSLAARVRQYLAFVIVAAWRMLTMPRQDVIVSMTTPPFVGVLAVLHRWRRRDTRLVLWCMDCYPDILEATGLVEPDGLVVRIGRAVNRWLLRRCDHVVCLDAAMRARLERDMPEPAPACSVIPNWEPHDRFPEPATLPRWSGLETLGLEGRFVILYMGNAGFGHDLETVLDAAETLRDDPVSFLFVGGGTEHARMAEEAARRGLDSVRCHPYVEADAVAPLLGSVDAALVVLSDEALGAMSPSKVHAYLAAGLPVIYVGPEGGNVDHAIDAHDCGVSVRHGDAAEVVRFVHAVRRDPHLRLALSEAARNAFDTCYCDRAVLPKLDAVLDGLVTPPRPPAPGSLRSRSAARTAARESRAPAGTSARSDRRPRETRTAR